MASLRSIRAWPMSEILVVLAWLTTLPRVVTAFYLWFMNATGNGLHNFDGQVTYMKMSFADVTTTWFPMYFVKGALLCFYDQIAPPRPGLAGLRWTIRITGVLAATGAMTSFFMYLLFCLPISQYW